MKYSYFCDNLEILFKDTPPSLTFFHSFYSMILKNSEQTKFRRKKSCVKKMSRFFCVPRFFTDFYIFFKIYLLPQFLRYSAQTLQLSSLMLCLQKLLKSFSIHHSKTNFGKISIYIFFLNFCYFFTYISSQNFYFAYYQFSFK